MCTLESLTRSVISNPDLGPHLHGVPRAPERGGVGEIELTHGVDGHLVENGCGRNVDALGPCRACAQRAGVQGV